MVDKTEDEKIAEQTDDRELDDIVDIDPPQPNDKYQEKDAYVKWLEAKKSGKSFNRNPHKFSDEDGNKFPAPSHPFIFSGGSGRPDEPPVAAGVYTTNRRKLIEKIIR